MWIGITLLLLYLGSNVYLFVRITALLSTLPIGIRISFSILFWLCAIALFVAMALRDATAIEPLTRILFNIGSAWLVFLLYMTLATLLFDIIHLIVPSFHYGTWCALGITILLLTYGYINHRHPRVKQMTITTEKEMTAPCRIAMVSDIHLGYGTDREDLAGYVDLINAQNADVVVVVGDLIDNSIKPVKVSDMCAEFERITAPEGVYMVAGNHEYISGIKACEEYLSTTPVRLVRDSVVRLESGVQLLCRDDRSNRDRATIESLLSICDASLPTILLDHQPYDIAISDSLQVDIHLSGHTHRGQVWPLNWIVDRMYEQSYGYRQWSHTQAFVSCGLSLWGPPFRIGTHGDIAIIDIIP